MKTITASNVSELRVVARTILTDMSNHFIFAFNGKMGAGKTTLIKAFCKELGVNEVVTSPTFALVNEYRIDDHNPVYHFDFYRVIKIDEVFDIGYEEYFYSDNYCLIEWPELVLELLPKSYVYISIKEEGSGRRIINYSVK
ncbi:MAG: tRNA (adenosine(37)-N6)-threonylcarbamoyltransferase complex ATPase subunit type 1 TsaE [Bacteroidetes bacterium]|nr:tRNA (adenosine(37)-N6)-threonylcarbamoyltransferase complex ATPase subunit type 1 TsaE [Bacteroidota bacterium]MBL6944722.1 tRNA (adenosine(37)-N6)-threonylcarbamoyltransferase complex ATPase subunit type 1 TsaE [Bacteroidales bacterium]